MIETQPVCGRFAPSPSGRMHAGNVFCALLAWLSARSQGGRMVLRIEDLDPERCTRAYAARLEDDLRWLGLDWDEGGLAAGGEYLQSACTSHYDAAFRTLEARGLLYPCFCTRAELHAASAPHLSDGRVLYAGTCRGLTADEIAARAAVRPPAMRLRVPEEEVCFVDGVYGTVCENLARETGDFLLRRADGVYAYQLAVVVDDGRMGVTEVVRGSDLLSSTARQLYLYRVLGLTPPRFTHIPLLCAPDGRRLSKRDRDLDLGRIRAGSASPAPFLGQLACLAGLIDRPQSLSARELLPYYTAARLPRQNIVLSAQEYRALCGA